MMTKIRSPVGSSYLDVGECRSFQSQETKENSMGFFQILGIAIFALWALAFMFGA